LDSKLPAKQKYIFIPVKFYLPRKINLSLVSWLKNPAKSFHLSKAYKRVQFDKDN